MNHRLNLEERNGPHQTTARSLRKDVGDFAHDVLTLAELQARLLVTDVKEISQNAKIPSLLIVCGMMFGMACTPIALVALALFVVEIFEVSYAIGFLVAAIIGAVFSGTLCAIGAYRLRNCIKVLNRSGRELKCNVSWLKNLLSPERLARKQVSDKV
jgi:uncharacterized membrane protein (DUF485 family)